MICRLNGAQLMLGSFMTDQLRRIEYPSGRRFPFSTLSNRLCRTCSGDCGHKLLPTQPSIESMLQRSSVSVWRTLELSGVLANLLSALQCRPGNCWSNKLACPSNQSPAWPNWKWRYPRVTNSSRRATYSGSSFVLQNSPSATTGSKSLSVMN